MSLPPPPSPGDPPHPAARRAQFSEPVKRVILAGALWATFPVAYTFAPFILRDSLPICPFRILTGNPCPLCGLTRAFALATHAHLHQATLMNPLWPLFAATILTFGAVLTFDAFTHRTDARRIAQALLNRWMWLLGGLLIFGALRIIWLPI